MRAPVATEWGPAVNATRSAGRRIHRTRATRQLLIAGIVALAAQSPLDVMSRTALAEPADSIHSHPIGSTISEYRRSDPDLAMQARHQVPAVEFGEADAPNADARSATSSGLGIAARPVSIVGLEVNDRAGRGMAGQGVAGARAAVAASGTAVGTNTAPMPVMRLRTAQPNTPPAIDWRGRAAWQVRIPSSARRTTEVYADRPSYLPGDEVGLAVSTSSASYEVSIWRLGVTPTLVLRSGSLRGVEQKAPTVDLTTGLARASWLITYRFRIPGGSASGLYLAKVHAVGGADAYAPFVLRSTRRSQLLFVANTLTDAAYNTWGGASFYRSRLQGLREPLEYAVAVSLDRPNSHQDGAGSTFDLQWPLARWLENSGYDVTYTTDWDLSRDPASTPLPGAVVFGAHSEYWAPALRDWLDQHVIRLADVGLALFGSNTGYWPVSLSADGRTITCYKKSDARPNFSRAPKGTRNRQERFRDPAAGEHRAGGRPEQLLFGVQYGSIAHRTFEYVLGSAVPARLLTGTGLAGGASLGLVVGGETDAVEPKLSVPAGQATLATATFSDRYGLPGRAQAVFRPLRSGKAVFAAGTFLWMWGLDPRYAATNGVPAGFSRLTANILAAVVGVDGALISGTAEATIRR
jgi:hypothetical protein